MPHSHPLVASAHAVAGRVIAAHDTGPSYTCDLALEALLEFGAATATPQYGVYVQTICHERGLTPGARTDYKLQPFSCLTFECYRHSRDARWLSDFLEQTALWRQNEVRSPENAVMHPRGTQRGGGHAILIDSLQCYAARMAAAGTVGGDPSYFQECTDQYRIHRELLRHPETGLWSQGRGWLGVDDPRLSPGAWSRGHGWLVRGMEQSLRHLPKESPFADQMRHWLRELAATLLALQSPQGLWHTLLNRPKSDSLPDTSGSAMIAHHLALAWLRGDLEGERVRRAMDRAFEGLAAQITPKGDVLSSSPGPGPLESEEPWLADRFPVNEKHGIFAVLFAASSTALMPSHRNPPPS
jgi:unsaturated rhamnogalacturonyl hydrolase